MDELRAITLFVRAADAGGFQRVAVEQGLSPQAVSKAIGQLERELGVRLFHRTTRSNRLTDEGLAFLEAVRPGLDAIGEAIGTARSATEHVRGPIRVAAAHSARKVLAAPMAAFVERYAEVRFDLVIDDGYTDLAAEQIDVAFRSGSEPVGQVVARRLFGVQEIVCAAPAYLARYGTPRAVDDLLKHRCTGFRQRETGRVRPWVLTIDDEARQVDVQPVYCANDPEAELGAVLAGMGVGLIDGINAAADVRAGRLVPLLVAHATDRLGFYLYFAQRAYMPRRVRAFVDFMVERLSGSGEFRLDLQSRQA